MGEVGIIKRLRLERPYGGFVLQFGELGQPG